MQNCSKLLETRIGKIFGWSKKGRNIGEGRKLVEKTHGGMMHGRSYGKSIIE